MTKTILGYGLATVMALAASVSVVDAVPASAQQEQQQTPPPVQAEKAALINVNTADAETLQKLPGVGPAMAKTIIEYREANGGFKKIEELMNVKGIGEKTFLKLKPLITVEPPKSGGR
jgi:competence protein ComEA